MTAMTSEIKLTIEGQVARITIDRAEKKNAMHPRMHRAMHRVLDDIEAAGNIKVAILTGVGDVFCGGMDLEHYFLGAFHEPTAFRENLHTSHSWMRRWKSCAAVTVASVNGWCVGGGLLMAALSDIMLVAREARFALSEVNFGIFPSGGTTWGMARNLGAKAALYYMLTAEQFDGDKAVELGLANVSVPRAELDGETQRVASLIAGKNVHALRYTKKVYERVRTMDLPEAQEFEVAMLLDLSYQSNNAWIEQALKQFQERKYRPGIESYREDPVDTDPDTTADKTGNK